MKTKMRQCLGVVFILTLTACAALGLAKPEKFDEGILYSYDLHGAITSSTAKSLNERAITKAHAVYVQGNAKVVRTGLDEALKGGCNGATPELLAKPDYKLVCLETVPKDLWDQLKLATGLLTQLQNFLQARGTKVTVPVRK